MCVYAGGGWGGICAKESVVETAMKVKNAKLEIWLKSFDNKWNSESKKLKFGRINNVIWPILKQQKGHLLKVVNDYICSILPFFAHFLSFSILVSFYNKLG